MKLNLEVVQGRELKSSRTVFCVIHLVDDQGVPTGAAQVTPKKKGSQNPNWNCSIFFNVDNNLAGVAARCYEFHKFFSDKFLGGLRLKFNLNSLQNDQVDAWFPLTDEKKKGQKIGELHIRAKLVGVDEKPITTLKFSQSDLSMSDTESSEAERKDKKEAVKKPAKITKGLAPDKPSIRASRREIWTKNDDKLATSPVIQIEDEQDDQDNNTNTKNDNNTSNSNEFKIDDGKNENRRDSGTSGKSQPKKLTPSRGNTKNNNKQPKRLKLNVPVSGDPSLPSGKRDQLDIIFRIINDEEGSESLIKQASLDDNENLALVFHAASDKITDVTLIIPDSIGSDEFYLLTADGVLDVGAPGSICMALNKVVQSFAKKNSKKPWPVFPGSDLQRGGLVRSAWAVNFRANKKVDDEEEDFDESSTVAVVDVVKSQLEEAIKFVKKSVGSSSIHVSDVNHEKIVRICLDPLQTIDPLLCSIWKIKPDKNIIVEMTFSSSMGFGSDKVPPISCYQADKDVNFNNDDYSKYSFGLQWFTRKRVEEFLRKNWPPNNNDFLFNVFERVTDRIQHCAERCIVCDAPLDVSLLKPTTCESPLCLFGLEELGISVDPAAEIASHPEVVDLLISFCLAEGGEPKRFTPYPSHIEAREAGSAVRKLQENLNTGVSVNDIRTVSIVINKLPKVSDMAKYKTSGELKEGLDKIDLLCYPLLRWILASNRAHLELLKPTETINAVGTTHQFLLLSSSPSKEAKFLKEKEKYGSIWAFHGSAFKNWHSIMHFGLRNMSGTEFMTSGAAYGQGIYLAVESGTSIGYAKSQNIWKNSRYNENGQNCQVLALCEIVNAGYKSNPYYVIPNEDHVKTRYLFLFNPKNRHTTAKTSALKIPDAEYLQLQKKVKTDNSNNKDDVKKDEKAE